MITVEFLLTSLVVVLMPGTGVIYTLSNGLLSGRRAAMFAALGCTAGIVPHLIASALGLAAILHMSALVFQVVKVCGVAYLLYLAWGMWRDKGVLTLGEKSSSKSGWDTASKGFLINILNPKLSIFFLAFMPQFIAPNSIAPMVQMLVLSLVFMALTFVVFIFYGLFANALRHRVIQSPHILRRLQRSFAAVFVFLSAKLATAEQ